MNLPCLIGRDGGENLVVINCINQSRFERYAFIAVLNPLVFTMQIANCSTDKILQVKISNSYLILELSRAPYLGNG